MIGSKPSASRVAPSDPATGNLNVRFVRMIRGCQGKLRDDKGVSSRVLKAQVRSLRVEKGDSAISLRRKSLWPKRRVRISFPRQVECNNLFDVSQVDGCTNDRGHCPGSGGKYLGPGVDHEGVGFCAGPTQTRHLRPGQESGHPQRASLPLRSPSAAQQSHPCEHLSLSRMMAQTHRWIHRPYFST